MAMMKVLAGGVISNIHQNNLAMLNRHAYLCHRQLHNCYSYKSYPSGHKIPFLNSAIHSNKTNVLSATSLTHFCRVSQQQRTFSWDSLSYYVSSDFPPIHHIQDCLYAVHVGSGLPWWATIALSTFALRSALFPVSVYSVYIAAKVQVLQEKFKGMASELKGEVASAMKHYGWSQKMAAAQYRSNMRRLIREEYIKENCHPMKATLVIWFQLPLWICCSFALRNISGAPLAFSGKEQSVMFADLVSGGALWFADFTVPDQTMILPVALAATNLLITEISALRTDNPRLLERILTNMLRFVSIAMIPIGAIMPSCMVYYWLCSSTCGLAQNLLLKSPRVRRILRIPRASQAESSTPYSDMYHRFKRKFSLSRFRKE